MTRVSAPTQPADRPRSVPLGCLGTRAILIAVIWLGLVLRLYHLDSNSLWADEVVTEILIRMRPHVMLEIIHRYDNHPPLFYALTSVSRVWGDSDFAARLPAALAGILSVPAVFVLARRLQMSTVAGLMASLLLATMPFHLRFSQEARSYTTAILLQIIALYWLYRSLSTDGRWSWLWYVLAMIAGLYTHYFAFLWLAAQAGFVLLTCLAILLRRDGSDRPAPLRRLALPFAASFLLCAVAYLPWYRSLLLHTQLLAGLARLPGTAPKPHDLTILVSFWRGIAEQQHAFALALLAAAIAGVGVGLFRRRFDATTYLILNLFVPALALTVASSAPYFDVKYLFPIVAPVLLMAAQGSSSVYDVVAAVGKRVSRSAAAGLALLGAAVLMVSLSPAYYRFQKEDWRGAASYLAAHVLPQDVIIGDGIFGDRGGGDALRVVQGLGYYLRSPTAVIKAELELADHLPGDQRTAGAAWGVIWYQGQLKDRASLSARLAFVDFNNLVLFRLQRPSGQVWQDAAAILEAMLELQPLAETHADLHLALMRLYTNIGEPGRAASHADAAQVLIPRGDSRLGVLANRERSHVLGAAREAARGSEVQAARSLYAQALAAADDPGPRFDILLEWGIFERFQANPQRAIELLEQALLLQPDHGEAHANCGAVLLDAGRLDEAIREFAFVIGKSPDHYWAHYYSGVAYYRSSRLPEAIAAAEQAARLPVDAALRSQAAQLAVEAVIQMGDCTQLRRIAQRYQPLPPSQQETIAGILASCP